MATKTLYKVQKSGGTKKYGVMAETFKELVVEGRKRLGLGEEEVILIMLENKKVVDTDNFQSLNPNKVLTFKSSEDIVKDLVENHEALSKFPRDIVTNCLGTHPNRRVANALQSYIDASTYDNEAEARGDDEEWFKDVWEKFKTKSEYMRYKATSRTRNYFYETREKLVQENDDEEMKQKKRDVIEKFRSKLKENSFYDKRFDRFADGRLCKENGEFDCQGAHNIEICGFKHHINPYLRKEYLIEFSSWNLDHQIEKGREVLPQLEKAVEDPSRKVNWVYFYDLLFTMENLKLVHPVCHDKKDHERRVDMTKVFLPV